MAVNTLLDLLMDRIQLSTEAQLANGMVQGVKLTDDGTSAPTSSSASNSGQLMTGPRTPLLERPKRRIARLEVFE
ncbi:hypothetical protein D918_09567 [Trichuris suis]|nr:hypothetical protein D918_09567 [Trichuris suis]